MTWETYEEALARFDTNEEPWETYEEALAKFDTN